MKDDGKTGCMAQPVVTGAAKKDAYGRAGSTSVFSICTDFSALGLTPSACRILGATCAVETRVFSTLDLNAGLETISQTFVSP